MGEAEIGERRGSGAANAALELRCHTAARETLPGFGGCFLGQGRRRSLPLAADAQELKNPFLPNFLRLSRAVALHIKCKNQHMLVVSSALTVMENGFTSS
jgi:hypothetical protein